ncbi:Short-chain dehydrogenase [Liquorilactobacillus satsumensis DSM 16230 = JCM 12392]|uniref:Short-chain dehydrogenase n=1 Tax=Liquorilactobacillus satsumensis DSM 16230 = JCM 12392 TaxID=1423801 RepID=A0A0R1UWD4_9LACO|nr:Short-chain dehydrogenase [Liquorilactobacillus satsumensis DSM 16230 = JCM 12392]
MIETNFWGVSNTTRIVLPIMRRQKSGYIINLSSLAGLVGTPSLGYYDASKHAVEGLMKTLLKEVKPLGINITNIEPGPFRTDWAGRSHFSAPQKIFDYDTTAHKRTKAIEDLAGQQSGSPILVAKAIFKLSQLNNPPLHFVAGKEAFKRAQSEIKQERDDFDHFKNDSIHLDFGNESYWDFK